MRRNVADIKYELDKLLNRFGASSKTLLRVRFGGVVGKIALVAVFVAIGLAVVARQTNDTTILKLCTYGIFAVGFVAIVAIATHGHNHPLEATLEGGEVIAYQHVQQQFAAKGTKEFGPAPPLLEGLGQKPVEATSAGIDESEQQNLKTKGELR